VLQNLIENGVKFNRPGGKVTVAIAQAGPRVMISVTDDGTGIAPVDLPHIFERFYTGNKSRTRAEGGAATADEGNHLQQSSGLGLAIAAKIVEAHGGSLQVATDPGRGTAFQFTLPCAAEPPCPPQQKQEPA
jgi:signal transduction histidine kinase